MRRRHSLLFEGTRSIIIINTASAIIIIIANSYFLFSDRCWAKYSIILCNSCCLCELRIMPILKMQKQRLRKIDHLTQSHIASWLGIQDSNLG